MFDQLCREDIEKYYDKKLEEILTLAVNQIPAHEHLAHTVERYKPREALSAFPLLDKDVLQTNMQQYLPRYIKDIPSYNTTTGGTTGNQLKIILDDNSQSIEMAFMHRQWQRVVYTAGKRKATFRGVSFAHLSPGAFWQDNPIYNEVQFSPFHMSESNLGKYFQKILEYRPNYFHGHPSAIDLLAEYILRNDLASQLHKIDAVLLGSEATSLAQRRRIEQAFKTRVYSWYGHSERVILAGECEANQTNHQFPDYGFLEIIDENGVQCKAEGERGEIVGTGFLNYSMPLIRYRTGDIATRLNPRCECGRYWDRFTDVEGRWKQDIVFGKSKTQISVAALNMHGPMFNNVIRYQYYQNAPGKCSIRVMLAPDFNEDDSVAIKKAYDEKVGGEVEFEVVATKPIPLTSRGKIKLLVSEISGG